MHPRSSGRRRPAQQRREFYLTDTFQYMIDRGAKIKVIEVEGWYDCGQVETLLETNKHLLETAVRATLMAVFA
jgi:glucose-1-phosphate thymidylyltransferase